MPLALTNRRCVPEEPFPVLSQFRSTRVRMNENQSVRFWGCEGLKESISQMEALLQICDSKIACPAAVTVGLTCKETCVRILESLD